MLTAALVASTSALVAAYYPTNSAYDTQIQGSQIQTSNPQGYQPYFYEASSAETQPSTYPSTDPQNPTTQNIDNQNWQNPNRRYSNQQRSQYYYAEPRTNMQYERSGQYYDQRSGQYYREPRTSQYDPNRSYNNSYNTYPSYNNQFSMNDARTDMPAAASTTDLQSRVRRAIQTEASLSANARNVGVSVDGDKVTLTGTVDTKEEKERVENITKQIAGVRSVSNKLSVK